MKTYRELIESILEANDTVRTIKLFEHEIYKMIPGTKNSYRQDPANLNTKTLVHSHTYAKVQGRGKQMYAVNFDGTGHDGSSGIQIPDKHADYFRSLGYKINKDNILECLLLTEMNKEEFELVILQNS